MGYTTNLHWLSWINLNYCSACQGRDPPQCNPTEYNWSFRKVSHCWKWDFLYTCNTTGYVVLRTYHTNCLGLYGLIGQTGNIPSVTKSFCLNSWWSLKTGGNLERAWRHTTPNNFVFENIQQCSKMLKRKYYGFFFPKSFYSVYCCWCYSIICLSFQWRKEVTTCKDGNPPFLEIKRKNLPSFCLIFNGNRP